MDGQKFDRLTRALASGASRRQIIKGLAGGAAAMATGLFGARRGDAQSSCVSFHTDGQGCNDPPGNNCCVTGLLCIGDNVNNPGAGHCGQCPAGTAFCPNPTHPGFCCSTSTQTCFNGECCTLTACPPGQTCGTASNGCGGTQSCGTCPPSTNPCKVAVCSGGVCSEVNATDGTACNDGNACTQTDTCQSGVCTGGNPVVCTPLDQCHVAGTCDPATGTCSNPNKADGSSCNDGDACTLGDTCQAGVCQGGAAVVCTASDQCHDAGTCDPATGTCSNPAKADGTSCSDGNACTVGDTCQAGVCTSGTPVSCTASDQCHDAGTCDPATGICSNPAKADGSACNDGNACTQTDTCQAGVCTGGNPVVCTASDQCHEAGVCDQATGLCSNPAKADGTSCSDSNICTQTDTCQGGVCTGANPVVCAPTDQCHEAGTCDPVTGLCSNPAKADGTPCDDGDACTLLDTCQAGVCTGSNPVVCTAIDQCHIAGTCNSVTGICSNPPKADGTTCNDGDACTQTDTCQGGFCTGGNPVVCTASDQCHDAGTCDPATGTCSNPAKADGTSCNDGDACTQTDTCQAGVCTGSNPVVCTASDQCHDAGTCDPANGTCSNPDKPDGTGCNDGDACTQTDTCQAGVCTGGNPVVCTASDQCHLAGTCDPATGTCSNPAKANGSPCDDGLFCTSNDTCQNGTCTGGPPTCSTANCQTCDEVNDRCVSRCLADEQCNGSGVCVKLCPKRTQSVFCPSKTGKGFKCCPTDSVCDYSHGTVANCRNI